MSPADGSCPRPFGRILLGFARKYRAEILVSIVAIAAFGIGRGLDFASDAEQYMEMVRFFRGEVALDAIGPEYRNRILVPLVSAYLPFDPRSSIQLVNLALALATVPLLCRYLRSYRFNEGETVLGGFVFFLSCPFVAYGAQPLTDMAGMFFTILILVMISNERFVIPIILMIFLGSIARETVIVTSLLFFLVFSENSSRFRSGLILLMAGIPAVILLIERTLVSSVAVADTQTYMWIPSVTTLVSNLTGLLSYKGVTVWLSIAPFTPFIATFLATKARSRRGWTFDRRMFMSSCIALSIIPMYGLGAAAFDGRFLWPLYPLLIPLMLYEYRNWHNLPFFGRLKHGIDGVLGHFV